MRIIYAIFFTFNFFVFFAQVNLVSNPGFETFTACPSGSGQYHLATGWNNVNMNIGAGAWGTPDYYHTCGTGSTNPPATFAGTAVPQSGNAMMSVVIYNSPFPNFREYLATTLTCSMFPGNTYTVSFWITNGTGIRSPWTIRNIGINFTTGPMMQSGFSLVTATPQIEITTNVASTTWIQYTFTINPTAPWTHMTFGAFRPDVNNNPTMTFANPGGPASAYANYFVDNFAVLAPASTGTLSLLPIVQQPTVCGGNGGASIVVSNSSIPVTYTWVPGNYTTSAVTNLSPGIYTVIASYLNSCLVATTSTQFTILPVTNPTVNITVGSNTTCAGNSVTLTSNISGGSGAPYNYTWSSGSSGPIAIVSQSNAGTSTYTLQMTDAFNCAAQGTVAIEHFAIPQFSVHSTPICSTENATLIASGANTYSWLPANSSGSIMISTPSVTTIYTVIGFSAPGCTLAQQVSQIVNPTPTLSLVVSNTLICPGDSVYLSVVGAASYTWYNNSNANNIVVYPVSATSFSVIGSSLGCSSIAQNSVAVKQVPVVSFNTFSITCGSLGSATAIINGGIGPFTHTWFPTSQTSTIANGLFPGTYTFEILDLSTGCTIRATENFLPLVPLTGTVTATPSLVCPGDQTGHASIQLSGGSGTQQYFWTDVHGVQTVANPTTLAAGTNTVLVSDLLTFCTVSHTFEITEPPTFTLSISASSPSVCLGDSIFLSALNAGGTPGYTYNWINHSASQFLTVNENTAGDYTISVLSIDSQGCEKLDSIVVRFVDNPTVTVTSVSICPLSQSVLTASGASTYLWLGGPSTNTFSVGPSSTTVYSVVGTSSACSTMQTATVSLLPIPTPTIKTNSPICEGDTLHLDGSGGNAYNWTSGQNFISNMPEIVFANSSPSLSGIYNLTVTAITGCTATSSQSVVINPLPIISANGATVCEGNTLQLNSNFVYGATYHWQGPNYFSTSQNPSIVNASLNMTGTYTLTLTSNKGCVSVELVNALVVNQNVVSVLSSSSVCKNSAATFVASGANEYFWYGPNSFYTTSATAIIPIADENSSGIYTLVASTGPCSQTSTFALTVYALPVYTLIGSAIACENQSFTLSVAGANTCTWSGPSNFTSTAFQINIPKVNQISAGVYSVTVSNLNGCKANDTVRVNFLPAPPLHASSTTVCLGGVLTLTASGGGSFYWNGPNRFSAGSATATIKSVGLENVGIYSVTTQGSNSCTSATTIQVTSVDLPLPLAKISGLSKVCLNTEATLDGSGGTSYSWMGPNNFASNQKRIVFEILDASLAGIYTLTVRNSFNCNTTATIQLNVFPPPIASIKSKSVAGCVPFCAEYSVSVALTSAPVNDIVYNIEGKSIKARSIYRCFEKSGDYLITATFVDINSCIGSSTLNVSAFEKPNANFKFLPDKPVAGIDQVQFYNMSTGASQTSWNWYVFGKDSALSNTNNPTLIFETEGVYPVALEVINKWGCRDTIVKVVVIENEFALYVPNAFTPNGDGINDIFLPKGVGVTEYEIEIYDRWGEKLFYSDNFQSGWDGFFRGHICKVDIYVWKIKAKSTSGKAKHMTGHVMITR